MIAAIETQEHPPAQLSPCSTTCSSAPQKNDGWRGQRHLHATWLLEPCGVGEVGGQIQQLLSLHSGQLVEGECVIGLVDDSDAWHLVAGFGTWNCGAS